jgi:hypothetical protein
MTLSPAYLNERNAYFTDRAIPNPHAPGTKNHQDWQRGYDDASESAW